MSLKEYKNGKYNNEEKKNVLVETKEESVKEVKSAPIYPKNEEKKAPAIPQLAKTIPDLTNIRKGPSIDTPVVKTVSKGAEFKVDLEKSTKEFVAVSVQGEIAFIKRELVNVYDNPAYTSNAVSKIG